MDFTYEANLPLLRRLAMLLLAFSDSDDNNDLEEQFEMISASEDDLYDKEATENDRKSDEEIEREAEEILDTIGNSILRLALSYLHNIEDAEDILQETMIKFVTVRPVFESESHRKAWLMRVASNLAKNRIDYNPWVTKPALPSTLMVPEWVLLRPAIAESRVDLPEPLRPKRPITSPF